MKKIHLITISLFNIYFLLMAAPLRAAPNFILILSDDQGWGTTSVMIDPEIPDSKSDYFVTPNIERLASMGMRFTQGYAAHPNCSPTRAALQTGRSPAALHITDTIERAHKSYGEVFPLIPAPNLPELPADQITIPMLLKAHNPDYRAALFGKWHLDAGGPERFGYDESDGPTANQDGNSKNNLPDDPKKSFSTTRKAIDFMHRQTDAGNPFFVMVSYYAIHNKPQMHPDTEELFKKKPKGKYQSDANLAGMTYDMDEAIGQLLDAVHEKGLSDNTYIIYTSDNGSVNKEGGQGNSNGPVRGEKATPFEGGIRVPFMVAGPGVKHNAISRVPVVTYDILPTVCDLAGFRSWPKTVEGGSLKQVMLEEADASVKRPSEHLVFHFPHYVPHRSMTPSSALLTTDGNWKLIYWWETGKSELFHLSEDLDESDDLADTYPERTAALEAQVKGYLNAIGAALPRPNTDNVVR